MTSLLQTQRLRLREIVDSDFAVVHAYASDPEVVEFMTWGPNTEQDTRDFLERSAVQVAAEPRIDYALAVVRRDDDRMIGAAGLHMGSADAHQAMLGYCYAREAWGQGYATEAALALVSFGFGTMGLDRVWAGCDPDNAASIHVLEKVGMRLEGRLRDDAKIRGVLKDSLVFGILAREWRGVDR